MLPNLSENKRARITKILADIEFGKVTVYKRIWNALNGRCQEAQAARSIVTMGDPEDFSYYSSKPDV